MELTGRQLEQLLAEADLLAQVIALARQCDGAVAGPALDALLDGTPTGRGTSVLAQRRSVRCR